MNEHDRQHGVIERDRVALANARIEADQAKGYNARGAAQAQLNAATSAYGASLRSHLTRSHSGHDTPEAWPTSAELAAFHDSLHAEAVA